MLHRPKQVCRWQHLARWLLDIAVPSSVMADRCLYHESILVVRKLKAKQLVSECLFQT